MADNDYYTYPPAGYCIYCGTTEGRLSKEHIIPYGLNGNLVLPKASCTSCAKRTQQIEEICLRSMFGPLRARFRMQTRRKKERQLEIKSRRIYADGKSVTEMIPIEQFPVICYGLKLPTAGILTGQLPTNWVNATVIFRAHEGEMERFAEGRRGCIEIGAFYPNAFFLLLTKIAYAFAAAELGTTSLFPMLADLILGRSNTMSYLIGGEDTEPLRATYGHRLDLHEYTIGGIIYVAVLVHLFGCMGMPRYHVVVSQKS